MSDELDDKLGERLRAGARKGRDPLFRVGVLQRREEDRFRARNRLMIAGAAALAVAGVAGLVSASRPDR